MNARLYVRLLQKDGAPPVKPTARCVTSTSMSVLEAMRLAVKHRDPVGAYALYLVGHRWVAGEVGRGAE